MLKCAERGLIPDGDQCAIVPFGKKAQFIMGYKGKLDLMRRAIPGIAVAAKCIWDGEHYRYEEGLRTILEHKPAKVHEWGEEHLVASYARAWMPGAIVPEVAFLYKEEIETQHRRFSKGKNTPWFTHYHQQCMKTAIHVLGKYLPIRSGLLTQGYNAEGFSDDEWDDDTPIYAGSGVSETATGQESQVQEQETITVQTKPKEDPPKPKEVPAKPAARSQASGRQPTRPATKPQRQRPVQEEQPPPPTDEDRGPAPPARQEAPAPSKPTRQQPHQAQPEAAPQADLYGDPDPDDDF